MSSATQLHALTARLDDVELVPWPLAPAQVIEGDPQPHGAVVWRSADRRMASGLWTCTPGRFGRLYPWTETAAILEGEATIRAGDQALDAGPGALVVLPQGIEASWEIHSTVKKAFQLSSDKPLPI
jgi:uncharacterized cupin superfamily protein